MKNKYKRQIKNRHVYCFVIIITLLFTHSQSQYNWEWSNPLPTGNSIASVVWTGDKIVAAGYAGTIMTSVDGKEWTIQESGTRENIYDVEWAGNRLIAVGENGIILLSEDGENWNAEYNGVTSVALTDVAWTGERYVAVGTNGTIITSPDGKNWVKRNSNFTGNIWGICWTGENLLTCGDSGAYLYSVNGENWERKQGGYSGLRYEIIWADTMYVAVGWHILHNTGSISISTDGDKWNGAIGGVPGNHQIKAIAWSGTKFIAAGKDSLLISTDGQNWTSLGSVSDLYINCAAYADTQFVLGGFSGATLTSSDGETWAKHYSGFRDRSFRSIIYTGSKFVAIGMFGEGAVSNDGTNWEKFDTEYRTHFYSITWTGEKYFAVGGVGEGDIIASSDCKDWESVYPTYYKRDCRSDTVYKERDGDYPDFRQYNSRSGEIYDITWTGTQLMAVRNSGKVLKSTDGENWENHSITNGGLYGIVWTGSQFVAVGHPGVIFTSPDGEVWTEQESGTEELLASVAWSGTKLVSVGYNSTILSSTDGKIWQHESPPIGCKLQRVRWIGDRFITVGANGAVFISFDGKNWKECPVGTNYYLEDIAWNDSIVIIAGFEVATLIKGRIDPVNISFQTHQKTKEINISVKGSMVQLFIPEIKQLNFRLFDIRGRVIASIFDLPVQPGYNRIELNHFNLSNGHYILSLEVKQKKIRKKINIIR